MSLALREDAPAVRAAIDRVVASGWFVLGPEVEAFEAEFAAASGASHAVGVGNGTDAIALILRALGIGPGDEVITTPLSAAYTALAVLMAGARPVFADIDPERLTIDADAIAAAVTPRTRAILPVHLYGQPADMAAIERVAARHNLAIVEDCCQAHLATAAGRPVGTIGVAGAFSFYPTKNLGALGDGGAVVTSDRALADTRPPPAQRRPDRSLSSPGARHQLPARRNAGGHPARAAAVSAGLDGPPARARRDRIAPLSPAPRVNVPVEADAGHVYHLFVAADGPSRTRCSSTCAEQGIETLIHYPLPIPRQPAMAATNPAACPHAASACDQVLSLPLHPGLADRELAEVAAAVRGFQ